MEHITTVTQKGQITIPIHFRKKMNIRTGTKINFVEAGGRIVLAPVPDLLMLRGFFKTNKKYNKKAIEKVVNAYKIKAWKEKLARSS
ncbi:AbrB/MazE/SpoVT family DNA-binding domain-containing protein [Candidatus Roizmanbacteria bacterium]|nr:AbrB/MazE/SpoVT family DNA-binding domain-containing protein [Candidatus Roizmanbacteria bacterium]